MHVRLKTAEVEVVTTRAAHFVAVRHNWQKQLLTFLMVFGPGLIVMEADNMMFPEQKCSSEGLGHIQMTLPVRISLGTLRVYLIAMMLMLGYHVLVLAGVFHRLK